MAQVVVVVWKYELCKPFERAVLSLPVGAVVVDFRVQGYTFCLWACVDPEAPTEKRAFVVRPTGGQWDPLIYRYVRTCHHDGYVWHLTELTDARYLDL